MSRPADPADLQALLGVQVDEALFQRALTHRSYAYEHGGLPTNERLEFLGDSVLGLVVTETLFRRHRDLPEGQLAKLRASVVNMRALASVAGELGLGDYVLLGRGEEATGGREKASILADTMEAVIGVVFLACGPDTAARVVHRLMDPLMEQAAGLGAALDWKTSLQELSAATGSGVPEYDIVEDGPDHEKVFTATAVIGGESLGHGQGHSKKEAEQQAAAAAWTALRERVPELTPEVAEQLSGGEQKTVEDFRAAIREDLEKAAKRVGELAFEQAVVKAVVDAAQVEVPVTLVQKEAEHQLEHLDERVTRQGLRLEQYLAYLGQSREQWVEQAKPDAADRLKVDLVLEEIVRRESIDPSDQEVDDYMAQVGEEDAQVKAQLEQLKKSRSARDYFKHRLQRLRTLEMLVARARQKQDSSE